MRSSRAHKVTVEAVPAPGEVAGEGILSSFIKVEAGGAQPKESLRVSMTVDPSRVDADVPVVLARFEDGKLIGYPTQFDRTTGKLVADVDHLSFLVAAAWAGAKIGGAVLVGGAVVITTMRAWKDGKFHSFDRAYRTPGGFEIFYRTPKLGMAVRRRGPGDKHEHPLLINVIGTALDRALRAYNTHDTFSAFDIDTDALPQVFVFPLPKGVMGDTPGTGNTIWLSTELSYEDARATSSHELFHIYQIGTMGAYSMATHLWWADATCEWAADVVTPGPFLAKHLPFVALNHPEPVLSGLGARLNPETDDRYLAGNAARFIEEQCPGTIVKSLFALSGRSGADWFDAMQTASRGSCDDFEDILHEYYLRYYAVPDDGWGEPKKVGTLNDYLLTDKLPPTRTVKRTLPALSAQYARFRTGQSGRKGTLVIHANGKARANLYLAQVGASLAPPQLARIGDPIRGTPVDTSGVVIKGFGDPSRRLRVNDARVVMSNPRPESAGAQILVSLHRGPNVPVGRVLEGRAWVPVRHGRLEVDTALAREVPQGVRRLRRRRADRQRLECGRQRRQECCFGIDPHRAILGQARDACLLARRRERRRWESRPAFAPRVPRAPQVGAPANAQAQTQAQTQAPNPNPKPKPKPRPQPKPQAKVSCYQACLHMCRPKSTFGCRDRDGKKTSAREYCDGLQSMPQKATKWDWGFATECGPHVPKAWRDKHPPRKRNPNRPPGV